MSLVKVDLGAAAKKLNKPFLMEEVAQVDHFALYLYLCEGAVAKHRHLTQDELFYVHSGVLSLDTDWGAIMLSRREFTVIPRGLSHLSGSVVRTVVLLFQSRSDPDRKNGHGRILLTPRPHALLKWSVAEEVNFLRQPYLPVPLAQVDEMSLRLVWCQGETAWHAHVDHDELIFVMEGRVEIGSELGPLSVAPDELVVIPRARVHRLAAAQRAIALAFIHNHVLPQVQMGR
jgi:homogentisate 1,2-dioxygenase